MYSWVLACLNSEGCSAHAVELLPAQQMMPISLLSMDTVLGGAFFSHPDSLALHNSRVEKYPLQWDKICWREANI